MRVAALVVLALALPADAARADGAAVLYDPTTVAQVDLALSADARQALIDEPREYVPATATVTVGGAAIGPRPAEVRLKGHGAFRTLDGKAAFLVKFAKADRVLGLKKLTLNNMVQDASMVHEALGYELLRAAGVAAPRTGFAYVRVDGEGYGLYLNLETYDDVSLPRLFATTQHLYEAGDVNVDVTPGGAAAYEIDEGDEDDRSDLEALIAAANATGGDWSAGMAGVADLGAMTRMWAGEQYLGHWDGYSVRAGDAWPNNYYLHSDEAGLFTMLPTGLDQTFDRNHAFPGDGDGVLISRCIADAACLQAIRDGLAAFAAAAEGAGARLDAIAATVARWRPCASREQAGDAAWQAAVTATRGFLRGRREEAASYLGAAAPAPDPALVSTAPPPLAAGCPTDPPPPSPPSPVAAAPVAALPAAPAARVLPQRLTARVGPRRDLTTPHRFTTTGRLLPPDGLAPAAACSGRVTVRVTAGRRTVSRRRALLSPGCRYASSVAFRNPRKFGGRRRLTVVARFEGNAALLPRTAAPRTVVVRTARATAR